MKYLLISFSVLVSTLGFAQDTRDINKKVKSFSHVIASPRINVVLEKGDEEKVRIVYAGIDEGYINIHVNRQTLHIYLDHARKVEKTSPYKTRNHHKQLMYAGAEITAYVTYKDLESLEIRGNQEVTCLSDIQSDEFRLRAYGENNISIASLRTEFFKASLYGENTLRIKKGKVLEQKYKLYGENKIDTRDMRSIFATASIFGEGNVKLNTDEEFRVDAFGEPSIFINDGAHVNRRLIFGKTDIVRY